jgi:hypothetical protein
MDWFEVVYKQTGFLHLQPVQLVLQLVDSPRGEQFLYRSNFFRTNFKLTQTRTVWAPGGATVFSRGPL